MGNRGLRLGLAASVAIYAVAVATPALAQSKAFNVPAQAAITGIPELARQADVQILVSESATRGKSIRAVKGNMSVQQALRRALSGTGLRVSSSDGRTFTLAPSEASAVSQSSDTVLAGDAGSEDRQEIVVTGTNIRGAPPVSPVIVTSRGDIQDAGINNLGEFARTLTQNFSGGQNPSVAGSGNQGGYNNINGSSGLNLRGLGADATLTLINGHRTAYDALNQGIDISAIPVAAIERVEVVADGASALYGSDAVGGVANIILRHDFQGLETTARIGHATDGGYFQEQYNAVSGTRWGNGGILAVVDFSHNRSIDAHQRSYTKALDPDATLFPEIRQLSLVAAGHQEIAGGLTFEFDAQYADRKSRKVVQFVAGSSSFQNGQDSRPRVSSFTIAPRLKIDLPAGWRAVLGGTYAGSASDLTSLRYTSGILSPGLSKYHNHTTTGEANAEGPLFETGGGTARLALGGGFRKNTLDLHTSSTSAAGVTTVTGAYTAHRNIYYAYGEASVPLVSASNRIPLIERLTVSAALRYENYRGVGDVFAPKFGLLYDPLRSVTLRGSWGRSFKAQTLNQEFQVRSVGLLPSSVFQGAPANRTILLLSGGNPNLKPERAQTWTAGAVLRPANRLSIEATYFDVNYKDRITIPIPSIVAALVNPLTRDFVTLSPSLQQISDAVASGTLGLSNQTGQPYNPASVAAIVDASLRNVSAQKIHGVDVALDYHLSLGASQTLRLTGNASYLVSRQQLTPGQPSTQLAGTIFDPPHWRARGGAAWQRSAVTLSAFVNYIGSNLDDRFSPFVRLGAFTSLDTIARFRPTTTTGVLRGFEATLSVINLLNEKPDIIRNTNPTDIPYDSTNDPATGRVVSLTLRKSW